MKFSNHSRLKLSGLSMGKDFSLLLFCSDLLLSFTIINFRFKMPTGEDDKSCDESENGEKSNFPNTVYYKCCKKSECKTLICINCESAYHKSCAYKGKHKFVSDTHILCCNVEETRNFKKDETDYTTLLEMKVHFLQELLSSANEKNELLKSNNHLLLLRINNLEEQLKPDLKKGKQTFIGPTNDINNQDSTATTRNTVTYNRPSYAAAAVNRTRQLPVVVVTDDLEVNKDIDPRSSVLFENNSVPTNISNENILASKVTTANNNSSRSKDKPDDYEFKTVTRRRPAKKKFGTNNVQGETNNGFVGAEKRIWIQLYRVKRTSTAEAIKKYIADKAGDNETNYNVLEMPSEENRFKRFLVTAPFQKMKEFYDPSFWPCGVGITRFSFLRNQTFLEQNKHFL